VNSFRDLVVDDDGSWFAIFRLCGPTEAIRDRTWVLPDLQRA